MDIGFKVSAKIQKPVEEVFQAVYDPKKLSAYFTTGGASAPLDEGTTVLWHFADYPGEIPVEVKKVIAGKSIAFEWAAAGDPPSDENKLPGTAGYNTRVEITFEALDKNSTVVTISESGWRETPRDLKSSYSNCHGWTQMSCCLKAYVEYGINLRKNFY